MRFRAASGRTVEPVVTTTAAGRRPYIIVRWPNGIVIAEVRTPDQVRAVLGEQDFASLTAD